MMAKMSGQRIDAVSSGDLGLEEIIRAGVRGAAQDIAAIASANPAKKEIAILVWNYHDDDLQGASAAVDMAVAGIPAGVTQVKLTHYRVDEDHSNAFSAWKKLGAPGAPSRQQYTQLEAASKLATLENVPATVAVADGAATLKFDLPRQAVSLVVLGW
jgi:xylan 1,4-beta-xylosidase